MLAMADLFWAVLVAVPQIQSPEPDRASTEAPSLIGRLLDEDREPIRAARIDWTDWCYYEVVQGSGTSAKSYRLETDQEGRFEFSLSDERAMSGALRAVQFHSEGNES